MRNLAPLTLVLGSFLFACAGSAGEPVDGASGAATATAANKITTGAWGEMNIVALNGKVSGAYFSQVGDPAHGGATCSFTFAGDITTDHGVDHAKFTATDGYDTTTGELVATSENGKPAIRIQTADLLNACMRSSPVLIDGFAMTSSGKLPADVAGYRSISSDKAVFYDRAGGAARAAYVRKGDTVTIIGIEAAGFVKARFEGKTVTTGFLKTSDLGATTSAASPATSLAGAYEIKDGNGISSDFTITASTADQVSFDLTAVLLTGSGHFGEIQGGKASLANGVATYRGDGCTIAFTFADAGKSADVTQEGACADFGAFVDVTGHYTKK